MSVSLSEFAQSLSTGTLTVRGLTLKIRALKDSESAKLMALFPRPAPPLAPDPNRGSLAPHIPNENDPAYLVKATEWYDLMRRLQIVVSCGFGDGEGERMDAATLRKWADEVSDAFTRLEVAAIYTKILDLMSDTAQQKARNALVVDLAGRAADEMPSSGMSLPENYAVTNTYAKLEVCAYFHIDPRTVDDFDPGLMALLREHVRVRSEEKAKSVL